MRAEAIWPSCLYVAFHCLTIGTVQAPLRASVRLIRESCRLRWSYSRWYIIYIGIEYDGWDVTQWSVV